MFPRYAVAIAFATVTAPAVAQLGTDDAPAAAISISDLNLARPSDQSRLATRVNASIGRLCRAGSPSLVDIMRSQRCTEAARASVTPQISRAIAMAQRQQRLAALPVRGAN